MPARTIVALGPLLCVCLVPCLSGQQQFEDRLLKSYLPLDSDGSTAVVAGDVDGDGDADLVFGNARDRTRLYLNTGTGLFVDATAARMPVHSDFTYATAMGDVDGDGDLDIVVGNTGQDRLYLNDGTGTFVDATASRMPTDSDFTQAIALGDVDGDGDLDIAIGNRGEQNRLYLNNGAGTFIDVTAEFMPVDALNTAALAFADVEGDGDLDLVLGNGWVGAAGQNRLYLNTGAGAFADVTAAQMPVDSGTTSAVVFTDVDGDGDPDLVFGNSDEDKLYLNNGAGTFTDPPVRRLPTTARNTAALASADMDGDGDLDLVACNGRNKLFLNGGTGFFTDVSAGRMPLGSDPTSGVAVVDVDGDGPLDIVMANFGPSNRVHLNNGAGFFIDTTVVRMAASVGVTSAVAFGDLDGDRDQDVMFSKTSVRIGQLANDGMGRFTDVTASRMPVAGPGGPLALADVDSDGDLDCVVAAGNWRLLYLNDGTGTFRDETQARLPTQPATTYALAFGDVDGDGDADIAFGGGVQDRLYINDGNGTFVDRTATQMPVSVQITRAVALGDVDGDGDLDMVLGNDRQNGLYLNDGNGLFTDVTVVRMPDDAATAEAVGLGDVDGDGDLDMVFGNGTFNVGQQDRLYLNDGTGTFADATGARMPLDAGYTRALALRDVDGDGDPDIVLGRYFGQDRLYVNDGTGTFADATAARMPVESNFTRALALGDVDGDDDLDILFGNGSTGTSQQDRMYINLHRHISTQQYPTRGRPYAIQLHAELGYATSSHTGLVALGLALSPVPLPVHQLGTFFLDPTALFPLPPVTIPSVAGVGVQQLLIPANAAAVGLVPYLQGLIINDATGRAHLTGYTADAIR